MTAEYNQYDLAPVEGGTVLASVFNAALDSMAGLGVTRAQGLVQAGLTAEQLVNSEVQLPVAHLERLVRFCVSHTADPVSGLRFSRQVDPAFFGVVGHLMHVAGNLDNAIALHQQYQRLISTIGVTRLEPGPGVMRWSWTCLSSDDVFCRQATEYILGVRTLLVRLIREPGASPLLAVHFRHGPPEDPALLAEYEAVFSCPVYFQQACDVLVFAAEAMKQPFRSFNMNIRGTLESYARQQLEQHKEAPSFVSQVRVRLRAMLQDGSLSRDLLANQLCMSTRSFCRRLNDEGSSYRTLLDELRFELARGYLRDPQQSVESTAVRLGFRESHSFIRWFRRLADCTPGEYRRKFALGD